MPRTTASESLADDVQEFVAQDFQPRYGELEDTFPSNETWSRMREIGTELWLDTGNIEDASELWTREFSALTTNNSLLNSEVQTGRYDEVIQQTSRLLDDWNLSDDERILEIAFILNARHGLKLVEEFDAYVSVEEHTDLAHDLEGAVDYARRYHRICPERFIVKIPFTPAGVLATRQLSEDGIPVNHTLGFSARQNYVIARIARPEYVNVFLGRLNSVVANNDLGEGTYVGEKATMASQRVIRTLRESHGVPSRQIGASYREGQQVRDLAGIDVMTMPPGVAREFLDLHIPPEKLSDRTSRDYEPPLNEAADPETARLSTLWDVSEQLIECVDKLEQENLDAFTADDLVDFFHQHGCGDVFPRWTKRQHQKTIDDGKIPFLDHWEEELRQEEVGLDSLMNLHGFHYFAADQADMDERVRGVLEG